MPAPAMPSSPSDRRAGPPGGAARPDAHAADRIDRPAITHRMQEAQGAKLVLVQAPAGFGKTTALQQFRRHLAGRGVATAWLTLDPADNDASRLLRGLATALDSLGPGEQPRTASPAARSAGPQVADQALALLDQLGRIDLPFALFLDEVEVVHEPMVLGLLRELLLHLPRQGQLLLASRSQPELGLGRLRARGELLEIDADLLRFTPEDTREFLTRRLQTPFSLDDVERLHKRTEGWAAALWLAALALERRSDRSAFIAHFSGSTQTVADYLADDVLLRQPAEVRDFLLRSSVLRDLSAPLCDAVLGLDRSAALLQQLERSGLFLSRREPTPDAGPAPAAQHPAYRYHALFADFLRSQLARTDPGAAAALHLRAAHWYAERGRPVPAISHALDGGDHALALRWLDATADSFLAQGRLRLLTRWFDQLPEPLLASRPLLYLSSIWALSFTRGPLEATARLERLPAAARALPEVQRQCLALRPVLLSMQDRFEEAHATGQLGLAQLPTGNAFADSMLTHAMAEWGARIGRQHQAYALLDAARRAQSDGESLFFRMFLESIEGMIDLQGGRLREAGARFAIAASASHGGGYGHVNGNAFAGVLYASVVYEQGDLARAEQLLRLYVPMARDSGLPDHMVIGYTLLSRIAFAHGEIDQAFQVLADMEHLGHVRQLPRVAASAKLERARLLLLQGHASAAQDALQRADDTEVWARVRRLSLNANDIDCLEIGRLRWQVAFGAPQRAVDQLDQALAEATATGRQRRALKLQVLQAMALARHGEREAALGVMGSVVRLACREGFVRTMLEEGEAAQQLVGQAALRLANPAPGRPALTPLESAQLQRLRALLPAPAPAEPAPATAARRAALDPEPLPPLTEPLTRQETRVLQLLAEGYANSAMAEKLFVSTNTVRAHLRSIHAKLGVHTRTRAVGVARRLGLID